MSYLINLPKDIICDIVLKLDLRSFNNLIKTYYTFQNLDWRYIISSRCGESVVQYFQNNYKYLSWEMYKIILICEPFTSLETWQTQSLKIHSQDKCHENIWYLSNLISLSITTCGNVLIPDHVESMKSLRSLTIGCCDDIEISDNISKLNNLISITISYCVITKVPESICRVNTLERLMLDNNKIDVLPESISLLINLTTLSVSGNELKKLPRNIFRLHKLKILNLSFNSLDELPPTFGLLRNLMVLNVDNNKFEIFPEELISHPRIEVLSLSNNPFTYIYLNSKNLRYINISSHVIVRGKSLHKIKIIRI